MAMELFEHASKLAAAGRYGEALGALSTSRWNYEQPGIQTLNAELLEMTGRHEQARQLAERLLRSSRLTNAQRACCENVIGRVQLEDGDIDQGMERLQRSASLCQKAGNLKQLCWIQSKLASVLAERSGPDAAAPLLADLRRDITRLGDHQPTALAHMFVGEIEARRGNFGSARRHTVLGLELLDGFPHVWLEAVAENILLALCVLQSRIYEARVHSARALELSDASGAAAARRSA